MATRTLRMDPIVIGGSGGSGTRVFVRLLKQAGIFMGSVLTRNEDAQPFVDFYDAWTPLYLKRAGALSPHERCAIDEDFQRALTAHHAEAPSPTAVWGAKNPRSVLLLRYWHERFPGMRFIHVIRHGLDMAFSRNQRGLEKHQDLILTPGERRSTAWARASAYWSRTNASAAYTATQLGSRYLLIHFEELCRQPHQTIARVYRFLALPVDPRQIEEAAATVRYPSSIGRWRRQPPRRVHEAMEAGREGLERFGYWDPETARSLEAVACAPFWYRAVFQWIRMKRLPVGSPVACS